MAAVVLPWFRCGSEWAAAGLHATCRRQAIGGAILAEVGTVTARRGKLHDGAVCVEAAVLPLRADPFVVRRIFRIVFAAPCATDIELYCAWNGGNGEPANP